MAICILLIDLGLHQYFLISQIPLDESVYLFSWNELLLISNLDSRLSFFEFFVCLLGIAGYFLSVRFLQNYIRGKGLAILLLFAFILSFLFPKIAYVDPIESHTESLYVNNLSAHFVFRSWLYFSQENRSKRRLKPSDFQDLNPNFLGGKSISLEYPLLHVLPDKSEFSSYFKKSKKGAPNIVFVIVESLSSDFVGEKGKRTGNFMPFLDSLSAKSLYWPNFLSTCNRTHNVLPASLASVPYTTQGKIFQQLDFPTHLSLISMLNEYYYSRFYCGVFLDYINMNGYLNYYKTDYLVKNWENKFDKTNLAWGYSDGDLFEKSYLDAQKIDFQKKKKLDVFLTISTHEPFTIPAEKKYAAKVDLHASTLNKNSKAYSFYKQNRDGLIAFSYTDDALRAFFEKQKQMPDYENTIYIVYGDHGSELCNFDVLSPFKIPLIIYSPLLKKPKKIRSVSSQLDLAPTLISYLKEVYGLNLPDVVPFLGGELQFHSSFENKKTLVLGRAGISNENILHDHFFLNQNELFKVQTDFSVKPIQHETVKKELIKQRKLANLLSEYTVLGNKIMPESRMKDKNKMKAPTFFLRKHKVKPTTKEIQDRIIFVCPDTVLPVETKNVKLVFETEFWVNDASKFRGFPQLNFSVVNNVANSFELVAWKSIQFQKMDELKSNSWNKWAVSVTIDLKELEKLKKNNTLKCYLYAADVPFIPLKNMKLSLFTL